VAPTDKGVIMSCRVVLAEDHALVRAGLRALLERIDGVVVVGEAGDAPGLIDCCRQHQPDVAITDVEMPGMSGIDALPHVHAASPATRMLVLSMYAGEEFVKRALHHGASGYLLKDCAAVELELAIRAVRAGERYLSPRACSFMVSSLVQRDRPAPSPAPSLTPRQTEILTLVAKGMSTRAVADLLGLSPKTVEAHRAQIMQRLGIDEVAGLVRYAVRVGLVGVDD
jgi:DNA-binding NarL/FixJ family response regulator